MSQELDNNVKPKISLQSFIKENSKKIILILSSVIISSIIYFFILHQNEKKNILIAEKYIQAGLYLGSNQLSKSTEIFEEIVLSNNKFYSILAFSTLLEKNLIKDNNKILQYFEKLENLRLSKDQNDLLIFKKSLYLLKNSKKDEANKLLKKIIDSNSNFKTLAEEIITN